MTLRASIEREVSRRLPDAVRRLEPTNYTVHPRDNLVASVTEQDFWDDLSGGSGSELIDKDGAPAKFCAAHSSSALAVNSFGPFKHRPEVLTLAGIDGFEAFSFEKQLPTGLRGTPPNLDAVATGSAGTVCIESKFLETLGDKQAKFSPAYEDAVERLADDAWKQVYQDLIAQPYRYRRLDAAQLVKHYLGMRYSLSGDQNPQVLMYVYWEPENWASIAEYRAHREEVTEFTNRVEAGAIRFVAIPYDALWSQWQASSRWEGMGEHLALLRARYTFEIPLGDS